MRGGNLYTPRSNRNGRRKLLAASALVVLLLVLDAISGGKLRAVARAAFLPLWGAGHSVYAAVINNGYFETRGALEAQIQTLTVELAQYQERAAAYDGLNAENADLARMVHLAQSQPGITAPIASSLIASPYGTFSVGAGKDDGVSLNDLVLSDDGFVIGTIAELNAHTALVSEIFAPGRTENVSVNGTGVALTGHGGENGSAQVPRGISVNEGDPVLAPQFRDRYVGIVGHVASSSASAFSDIIVRLPVNLNVIRFVYVVPAH